MDDPHQRPPGQARHARRRHRSTSSTWPTSRPAPGRRSTRVDPTPYFQKYGANIWAAVKGYLDAVGDATAAPVIEKYTGVLAAADVFTPDVAFWLMESIRLNRGYGSWCIPDNLLSAEQRDNLEAILRQSAFPAGSDVNEQRRLLRESLSAQPLPADVTVTAAALGGVPTAEITVDGVEPRHVVLYFHGGVYVMGDAFHAAALASQVGRRTQRQGHLRRLPARPRAPVSGCG